MSDQNTEFQMMDFSTPSGSKRSMTPQGFLLIEDCTLATAGVLEYRASNFQPRAFKDRDPNSTIRAYRSSDTIAEAATQYSGAPVTDGHPSQMVSPLNISKFQKGHINGTVREESGKMKADVLVTDRSAIDSVSRGKDQLSNGYYSQYSFEPGVSPEGESYDCEQLKIRPNHVAIVAAGRNGPECRMSDSIDRPEEKSMASTTINGVSYEVSEQVSQAVGILQANLDKANQKVNDLPNVDECIKTALDTKTSELQKALDAKQAEVDDLKTKIPTADELEKLAIDREKVVSKAKALCKTVDCSGKSLADIKSSVVLDRCSDLKTLDGKSEDYIDARFDALTPANKLNKGDKAIGDAFTSKDASDDDKTDQVATAREKAILRKKEMAKRK